MPASSPPACPKIYLFPAALLGPRNLLNPSFTAHFDPSAP